MDNITSEGVVEHTGFPNPATDTNIVPLDLSKLLIKHPLSTFYLRIDSNAWEEYGVFKDDIALVDKALTPRSTDLVVGWDEDSFVISRYRKLPQQQTIWGVVTTIIHRYRS